MKSIRQRTSRRDHVSIRREGQVGCLPENNGIPLFVGAKGPTNHETVLQREIRKAVQVQEQDEGYDATRDGSYGHGVCAVAIPRNVN